MDPLNASGLASSSMAGNSRSGLRFASLDVDSSAIGDPVPARAIWRVTPEPAIAGVAADVAMSETSNVIAARYAMNRGFKSLPSQVMRRRRGGDAAADRPALPPTPAYRGQSHQGRL